MTKAASEVPLDIPTLARWLALAPEAHIGALGRLLGKAPAEQFQRLEEPARIALKWAWDEQPDVFFPPLEGWVQGRSARLRRVAVGALPLSHEAHRERCRELLAGLILDADPAVRLRAIDVVAEDPDGNMDLVARWANDDDPGVRTLMARHLARVRAEALPQAMNLIGRLALDGTHEVHWAAASTLLELYERDSRGALDVAFAMAEHPDEDVRAAAAGCFFEHVLADHFDQLLPTLRTWLRGASPELRWTLVRSLRFVRVNPRSLQLIRALYEDRDPDVRRRLILALLDLYEAMGEHARALCEVLRRAREDPAKRVRDVIDEGERRFGEGFDTLAPLGEDEGLAGLDLEGYAYEEEEDDD